MRGDVQAGDDLVVSEVFGPTWQGEGPSLGRRAGFIRLGRCNLECLFCDTPYTWRWSDHDPAVELTSRSVAEIVAEIEAMGVPLVVVTGGEPLVQQARLVPLLRSLRDGGWAVEVETAGTIAPAPQVVDLVTRFNVSPKLANSGNPIARRYRPEVLRAFESTGRTTFKFVAVEPSDLDEIAGMVDACGLSNVWVMPEATDAGALVERSRALAEHVSARGWNFTTRLQVLLWGNRRGV